MKQKGVWVVGLFIFAAIFLALQPEEAKAQMCFDTCSNDNDCSGRASNCVDGCCVECGTNSDCSSSEPYCDTSTNTCAECLKGSHCDSGQICDTSTNTCIEWCNNDADCPQSQPACESDGQCYECTDDSYCASNEFCNTNTHTCQPLPDCSYTTNCCSSITYWNVCEDRGESDCPGDPQNEGVLHCPTLQNWASSITGAGERKNFQPTTEYLDDQPSNQDATECGRNSNYIGISNLNGIRNCLDNWCQTTLTDNGPNNGDVTVVCYLRRCTNADNGDICQGLSGDQPNDQQSDGGYCDTNNRGSDGYYHCCDVGQEWNPSRGRCVPTGNCYGTDPTACNYDFNNNPSGWWSDPDCYVAPNGCCDTGNIVAGEKFYDYQGVTSY